MLAFPIIFSFNTEIVQGFEILPGDLFIQHNQNLGYWWPGDERDQAIGSHDTNLVINTFKFQHQKD